MAGTFNPMAKSAFGTPQPVAPTNSFAPQPAAPPGPRTPEEAAAASRDAHNAGANAAVAASPTAQGVAGKTPAQALDYSRWMNMTPQQQQDYVKGQGEGAANAGKAANTAGMLAAQNVGPGGPMSQNPDDVRQRAADAAGLDMMKPGANEAWNAQHGTKPLEQSGYADWLEQNRMDPNKTTMQQDFATRTLGQSHGVGDADFDKYYDRSEQNATQKLNDQLSARGTYGSSVGLGQIGSMLADMEGNRARDKAQYGLSRSADDRGWTSAQGDLAAGADSSGIQRWATAADAEAGASKESLDRWKASQGAAESAQGSQRTRGQDFFNNNMSIGGALSDTAGKTYDTALVQDQGLVDAVISLGLGKDAESVAQIIQRANQNDAQAKQILDLAMTLKAQNQPAAAKP